MNAARRLFAIVACLASFTALGQGATPSRPFSDRSFWNARPTDVKLGTTEVPKSDYFPTVAEGAYSVRVFVAKASDPPMTVVAAPDKPGIWNADAERMDPSIVIPHWPAGVTPATGGDGHADIVDPQSGRIHSFYQLKFVDGRWRTTQYTWCPLDGRGWGEPGHYFQGSRATGVPPTAGLIRSFEVDDGQPSYRHALAMSMAANGLSANPDYVFPATSADIDAAKNNHGAFPEGTLMMLPPDFDVGSIKDPKLAKVVRTLQSRGAYVVDENSGTPFAIYVEIGSNFSLMPHGGWDAEIAAELDRIRAGLRAVVSVGTWLDAHDRPFTPERNLNLLSMRGPWYVPGGGEGGTFDTWQQAVVFPEGHPTSQLNGSDRTMQPVHWAVPKAGQRYRLKVTATAGATLRFAVVDAASHPLYDSGALGDGQGAEFRWPADGAKPNVTVASGPHGGGRVGATLVLVDGAH